MATHMLHTALRSSFLSFFLLFSAVLCCQTNETRILILGNTADIPGGSPFFPALRQLLLDSDRPVRLILAGDLIDRCFTGEPEAENLPALFETVRGIEQVEATVVPGDRDWGRSGKDGYDCARRLEKIIEKEGPENMHWPIDDACPGPEITEIAPDIILININTQWWNHPHRKPTPADAGCEFITPEVILEEIRDAIEENLDKYVLVAGHFPPVSLGEYGGRFPLSAHLLPPVIGSFKVAYRQNIGGSMDLSNEHVEFFAGQLQAMAMEYQGLVFLSGHEHNQQILNYRGNYVVNSGAPVKGAYSLPTGRAILSSGQPGILELAYEKDEKVNFVFHRWTGRAFAPDRQGPLFLSPCQLASDTALILGPPTNCLEDTTAYISTAFSPEADSAVVVAGEQYEAGKLKQLLFGPHYRRSWTTPVTVPYLNLDTVQGGLRPLKRGGGRQTISLKLQAANGEEFVFRSVDKDPAGAFSILLRNTFITDVTRDQTSSQHPYGALVVAPLLDEIDILHADPHLYVMPPHPRLGPFQSTFGGMLGMLEERPGEPKAGRPAFWHTDHVYKSHELFQRLLNDPSIQLDATEFARARLFDLLIGDWSKHEDNWKWAGFERGDRTLVRPIPRDRDHAFSNLDGLFPWLADRQWAVPNLESFRYEIKSVRSLTFQARHMDRFLTSGLSRRDWQAAAERIQKEIDDEDIHRAVSKLPAAIHPLSGPGIESKLKQRIKDLPAYAATFYELLAREVDIVGTNEDDHFIVQRHANGATTVARRLSTDSTLLFQRTFLPQETKEIRLFGLHGEDEFDISGEAEKAIRLRVVGGPGKDPVRDLSQVRRGGKHTFIYERSEDAAVETGEEGRRVRHWNDDLYHYDRTAFAYNSYLPLASLGFNSFNGLSISGGVQFTRRRFDKRPYGSKHKILGSFSTLSNYTFQYEGQWHEILHKWDISALASYGRPIIYNFFFGLGNQTANDEELFRNDYYRFFINALNTEIGLTRPFLRRSFITFSVGYENNRPTQTQHTILADQPALPGNGELDIFKAGVEAELDLRDHEVFPTRGIRLAIDHESGFLSEDQYRVTDLLGEFFITPHRFPVTVGFQAGFSTSNGATPFYKLPSLGLQRGLRGFQRNRFTGDERLYWNAELRIPLGSIQTPVLPLRIGLRGFYDQGKIRGRGERGAPWRAAYGGGFYLTPLTRSYTFSVVAGFSEEESGLIGFQLGTNF